MPLDDALGDFEHQRLRVEDGAVEIKDDGLHRHCRHEPGFIMQSPEGGGGGIGSLCQSLSCVCNI